ncbi:MAG: hypothetical protein K1Y02_05315 [Candidatus Hydrogenedentes bacterium]|nr:hypothetical protein [Candidatus Hydrogenedentota bacterium]
MAKRILFSVCVLIAAAGCPVVSLQPLYNSTEELVFKPELVGRWAGDDAGLEYMEFSQDSSKMYTMTLHEKDNEIRFAVGMVEVKGRLFLDLLPEEPKGDSAMWLQQMHEFWSIDLNKDTLAVKRMSGDWTGDRSEKGRLWVRHEIIDDKTILTAKPDRLKRFVRKWVDDPDAFAEAFTLHRVPSPPDDAKPSQQ